MEIIKLIKQKKLSYNGSQVVMIKYISMRERMGKPVVSVSEIMAFNPIKFKRKDSVLRTLKSMVNNSFVKEKDNGYIITNIGKQVPYVVANLYMEKLTQEGKRTKFANEDWNN